MYYPIASTDVRSPSQTRNAFLGLAPFLRMSIACADLRQAGQDMLAKALAAPDDANLLMNVSIASLCLGQRDIGLAIQDQALQLQRVYHLAASKQPARFRLLMLMAPGDLAANTPLECLLENVDVDLDFYYVGAAAPFDFPVPQHDALIVTIGESDQTLEVLRKLEPVLANWPKPVINLPQHIPSTGRAAASALLQDIPGLVMPPALRISRSVLDAIAAGRCHLRDRFDACDFPVIVRPSNSHGGHGLEKIDGPGQFAPYLSRTSAAEFYLARFIDYSSRDGFFRKFRIALIDGKAFACHMAVSSNWMVHYVNAGMYQEAWKREEEAAFMAQFDLFAQHHQSALQAICTRTKLDYLCIDCAQTRDGQLLVFEIDHAMVIHAMDLEYQFPFKQVHMQKVKDAFRDYLFKLTSAVPQAPDRDRCDALSTHEGP